MKGWRIVSRYSRVVKWNEFGFNTHVYLYCTTSESVYILNVLHFQIVSTFLLDENLNEIQTRIRLWVKQTADNVETSSALVCLETERC